MPLAQNIKYHFSCHPKKIKQWCFNQHAQRKFLADLIGLLDEGVVLHLALETLSVINKGLNKEVAYSLYLKIQRGGLLADGMRNWFPRYLVELVRLGEQNGCLVECLKNAHDNLKKTYRYFFTVINGLIYPGIIFCTEIWILVFFKKSIIHVIYTGNFQSYWFINQQNIKKFVGFFQHWWWVFPILTILILITIYKMLTDYIGEGRKIIDKLPLLSFYRQHTALRFMEILGFFIANGMALKQALKIMQHDANSYLASHILMMEYRLGGGKNNIVDIIDTGLINKVDILRLRVLKRENSNDQTLLKQARFTREKIEKKINSMSKIFQIISMVICILLALFMIAIFSQLNYFICHQ